MPIVASETKRIVRITLQTTDVLNSLLTPKYVKLSQPTVKVVRVTQRGLPGADATAFVHTQSVSSNEWIVNHNFGYKPITEVLDSAGNEVEAEIIHISINQLRVYFSALHTGQVRCI